MKIFRLKSELTPLLEKEKANGKTIGFVPTMGALHNGHLSLVKKAKEDNDLVVVSIFVNPTQFNDRSDFQLYPKTEEQDIQLLESEECDFVYIPGVEDVYPNGENTETLDFGGIETIMEGKFRPGHFDGVATVVYNLFSICLPDKAYFGEKDYQQLMIVKKMVSIKGLDIEIVPIPIFRDPTGLALSSRNLRLTPLHKSHAPFLYEVLTEVKEMKEHGLKLPEIRKFVELAFKESDFQLEYFEVTESDELEIVEEVEQDSAYRAFLAVYADDIRLIDNMEI